MKRRRLYILAVVVAVGIAGSVHALWWRTDAIDEYTEVDRLPAIRPDYSDLVIPPNIAPLNFTVLESGRRALVRVYGAKGEPVTVNSRDATVKIPAGPWKALLEANKGGEVLFDVFMDEPGKGWRKYRTFSNRVAVARIDSYLVYRFMRPVHNWWRHVGIYQRNVEKFDRTLVLHGDPIDGACVNCHTFLNNSPDRMAIGLRSRKHGSATLVSAGSEAKKIGAKWGYTAWHPNGKFAVYSVNKVRQFFHTAAMENRDVVDLDSAILYYVLDSGETKTIPALSRKDRLETYPAWSPDGRYLYYCSAPILWDDRSAVPPLRYDQVRYDLMRVGYDPDSDTWGQPETVLAARDTGLSILLPRVTPDGKFLVFAMCDYGCFPVFQPSSDLYIMAMETGEHRKLDVNSEYAESWHSFSSNGRWMAFSSKKRGGLFTRTYLTYLDADGVAHKPFILPQEEPTHYDALLHTYSVPELITQPVPISPERLVEAACAGKGRAASSPIITGATPKAGDPLADQRE